MTLNSLTDCIKPVKILISRLTVKTNIPNRNINKNIFLDFFNLVFAKTFIIGLQTYLKTANFFQRFKKKKRFSMVLNQA